MRKFALTFLLACSTLVAISQPLKQRDVLEVGVHYIVGINSEGIIELEDGSQFTAAEGYAYVLYYWDPKDKIIMTPNNDLFASSQYHMTNLTKNESVRVDISRGSNLENAYTYRLIAVNHKKEEITLSNLSGVKSCWKIHHDDFQDLLEHWKIGNSVIVGKNSDGWASRWFSNDPHILICYYATNFNLYVRATQIPL
jgi:hypothetical protein